VQRVLWEKEDLVTYGFDGTAALYGEAGCVALPKKTMDPNNLLNPGKIFDQWLLQKNYTMPSSELGGPTPGASRRQWWRRQISVVQSSCMPRFVRRTSPFTLK
jgi:hypothetical protein